jgi:5'-3' exonuclease
MVESNKIISPPASSHALPKSYAELMISKKSPIKSFYPEDFKVDLNGKKRDYLGVVLLPFIDQHALLNAIEPIKDQLSEEEKQRNSPHQNSIFVHASNRKLFDELMKLNDEDEIVELKEDGCHGFIENYPQCCPPSGDYPHPFLTDKTVTNNMVLTATYHLPHCTKFTSSLLEGVNIEKDILSKYENVDDVQSKYQLDQFNSTEVRMIRSDLPLKFGTSKLNPKERKSSTYYNERGDSHRGNQRDSYPPRQPRENYKNSFQSGGDGYSQSKQSQYPPKDYQKSSYQSSDHSYKSRGSSDQHSYRPRSSSGGGDHSYSSRGSRSTGGDSYNSRGGDHSNKYSSSSSQSNPYSLNSLDKYSTSRNEYLPSNYEQKHERKPQNDQRTYKNERKSQHETNPYQNYGSNAYQVPSPSSNSYQNSSSVPPPSNNSYQLGSSATGSGLLDFQNFFSNQKGQKKTPRNPSKEEENEINVDEYFTKE